MSQGSEKIGFLSLIDQLVPASTLSRNREAACSWQFLATQVAAGCLHTTYSGWEALQCSETSLSQPALEVHMERCWGGQDFGVHHFTRWPRCRAIGNSMPKVYLWLLPYLTYKYISFIFCFWSLICSSRDSTSSVSPRKVDKVSTKGAFPK